MRKLRYDMRGMLTFDGDEELIPSDPGQGEWLFEPDRMLMSTRIGGSQLKLDLTRLIEGDVDLESPLQGFLCADMDGSGRANALSIVLRNTKVDSYCLDMNWDLGIAIASMDFIEIGRRIVAISNAILEMHADTLKSLVEVDSLPSSEASPEDFILPQVTDHDLRLENILKDILSI